MADDARLAAPLAGTTALVTGASSGIGEATARRLAALGADVALVARRRDRIEALAKEIESGDGRALVVEADVTSREQAEGAVQTCVAELGRLDILVNNAGVMLLGPIADAPVEEWEQMVQVNLLGLLYCAKAALPHLVEAAGSADRRTADLVNVSSVAGRVAREGSGVYNATKHGVGAFSESLRQEVTRRHVRVGLVEPGAVATELSGHNRPEVLEGIKKRFTEMERLAAGDIADAIAYMVTRPRHMAVNEMLIRPTEQQQ
jgi:NADP-dependent 3-hydroxy acid dehydrogenase YdfG